MADKRDYRPVGKKSSGRYENVKTGQIISRRQYDKLFHKSRRAGTFNLQDYRYLERLWDKLESLPDDATIMIRVRGNILFYENRPKQWVTIQSLIYNDTLKRRGYISLETNIEGNIGSVTGYSLLWK